MNAIGIGFIAVTAVCFWALATMLRKADSSLRPVSVGIGVWILIIAILGYVGFFENLERFPPRTMMFVFIQTVSIVFLVFISRYRDAIAKVSSESVYALQSFRIPVEILLVMLASEKLLPREITWSGWNFDVVAGATALVMSYLAYKKRLTRRIELAWNWVGLALVLIVSFTGILSAPTVFQVLKTDPPNFIMGYFPIVFLPHFLVPLAITLHLIVIRRLLVKESPV